MHVYLARPSWSGGGGGELRGRGVESWEVKVDVEVGAFKEMRVVEGPTTLLCFYFCISMEWEGLLGEKCMS